MVRRRVIGSGTIGGLQHLMVYAMVFLVVSATSADVSGFSQGVPLVDGATGFGVSEAGALLLLATVLASIAAAARRRLRSRKNQG